MVRKLVAIFAVAAVLPLFAAEPQSVTVRGTVLYCQPWQFFLLKTESGVLRVASGQGEPALAPGDIVDARGVMARRNGRLAMEAAFYAKTGETGALPEVQRIHVADLPRVLAEGRADDLYGMPVRFTARVEEAAARDWGFTEFVFDFEGTRLTASLQGSLGGELAESLALQPRVEVTGFIYMLYNGSPDDGSVHFDVRIAHQEDIVVVPDAAFTRRLMMHRAIKLLRLVPIALLIVILFLSVKLLRVRRAKDRLQAVLAERRRMAADLHDSIEQHLAGARLYLDSMLPGDGSPAPEALRPVELAREILVAAKQEIRATIWNLRIDELTQKRPADVLASLCERLASTTGIRVGTVLKGLPEALPEKLFSDVLYVIQEAATNAIKHGGATRLIVAAEGRGPKSIGIRICNNGQPFDTARALGPESGHFGLSGMRERAHRSGFSVSVVSRRHVTSVRMEITLP